MRYWIKPLVLLLLGLSLVGCGGRSQPEPVDFTVVPTYTPTLASAGQQQAPVAEAMPPAVETTVPALAEPVATSVPVATATAAATPTSTPTSAPSATPTPTETLAPTETPTSTPTPTPDFAFELEASEQFPTQVPDVDEVRIYLYVYAEETYALEGYTLYVLKDGEPLPVQARSTGGLPGETRPGATPYTRFANLGTAFFEDPAGEWQVQLLDPNRMPVGPPVTFMLSADDPLREFYVRYRLLEE